MKDRVGNDFLIHPLWTLVAIGGGFLFIIGLLLTQENLLGDANAYQEMGANFQNFTLEAQIIAMLFWASLTMIGGIIWMRVFFRSMTLTSVLIASSSLGLLLMTIILIVVQYGEKIELSLTKVEELAFLIASLVLFALFALLALIVREVIVAMFL